MALFNAGYPVTYQPMIYPSASPQGYSAPSQAPQNGIIWVSGEAGAKSYLVAPNNTVVLFDSENQTVYLKSADATGMPSMKVLDYTVREAPNLTNKPGQKSDGEILTYATKDELRAVSDEIKAIRKKLSEMEVPEA